MQEGTKLTREPKIRERVIVRIVFPNLKSYQGQEQNIKESVKSAQASMAVRME